MTHDADRDDWGTPDCILDAVRAALGGTIDLDPASSAWHNERVGAKRWYGEQAPGKIRHKPDRAAQVVTFLDGLKEPWAAETLYVNPPYSRGNIEPFVDRFLDGAGTNGTAQDCFGPCCERHGFSHGIILVNVAPETRWQQKLLKRCAALCWFSKRIGFVHPTLKGGGNRYAQVAFYFGGRPDRFRDAFRDLGVVR